MALGDEFVHGEEDTGVDASGAIVREAEVDGYFIGGFEAYAIEVVGEGVGVGFEDLDGLWAVAFNETDALAC